MSPTAPRRTCMGPQVQTRSAKINHMQLPQLRVTSHVTWPMLPLQRESTASNVPNESRESTWNHRQQQNQEMLCVQWCSKYTPQKQRRDSSSKSESSDDEDQQNKTNKESAEAHPRDQTKHHEGDTNKSSSTQSQTTNKQQNTQTRTTNRDNDHGNDD